MAIRVFLLAAIVICLCACAEPKPRSVAEPNDKALCCQSLDQMKFAPLPLDYSNPTNVVMDQSSPLYAFESGKSYFAAVRLPPESQASDLAGPSQLSTHQRNW